MKLLLVLLVVSAAFASEWEEVRGIEAGQRVEVTTSDGARTSAAFVSASAEALVVREKSGERAIERAQIRRVRVSDPARRLRRGLLWTAVGAAAGAAIGAAICPSCPNEGSGYKFIGPGLAIGAGVGALRFLSSPYRTVYRNEAAMDRGPSAPPVEAAGLSPERLTLPPPSAARVQAELEPVSDRR
jgi:hypothetical protein